jgi:(1->4)-alpha-D-glucan 1-alpha-D-glucosylmutase
MKTDSTLLIDEAADLCACPERLADEKRTTVPLSTYRLQFNGGFKFEDARRLVPYLAQLGITHCYASPILRARLGSQHGYDIIDHNHLNPEIGSESEFRQFVAELKSRGMGLIVDTVPNHMGVGHGDNPWWQDVLQNGRTSVYADFFDIDWSPLTPQLQNKVLIPILGNPYGEDLEAGNIKLAFENGKLVAKYFDTVLPIDPQTFPLVLAPLHNGGGNGHGQDALPELESLTAALGRLPVNSTTDPDEVLRRQRELPELTSRLQTLWQDSPGVRTYIERALKSINGTPRDPSSFDALHTLLEKQAYRLAFWRVSGEEINYRRFFDINDLVGLRMENPRVFAETHKLIRRFLAEGLISGLRIDHPDGLLNPAEYFMRLQRLCAASRCLGAEPRSPAAADGIELDIHAAVSEAPPEQQAPLYLLIEKILERGEHLHPEWQVDGSVGYDFANLVNGVLIDHRHAAFFTKLYHRVIDVTVQVDRLIYESKKLVMRRALASEVNVLTHMLNEISNGDRRARDFTRGVLREAIRETIAFFPVYRTYIDERGRVSDDDRKYIEEATRLAQRHNGTIAAAAFDFVRHILLLENGDNEGTLYGYQRKLYFTLKFQQLTGPVMAKGLEDTACYIYARFISSNEVGGTPAEFGLPVSEFHRSNQERAERWPASMLATSTHDTKRSEDVRARLNVLSEMPSAWATQVMKWRRINRGRKVALHDGRIVPDNNEEYFLYQTIIGAWPLQMPTEEAREEFVRRIQQYIDKALHEAKVNLSWLNPNPEYVGGMNTFIERILAPRYRGKLNLFWDSLQKFLPPVMYFGAMNSLSQVLLKLTCPGVSDVYQGQEMWDFSLVDPDNRRPVDFELRARAAMELREWATTHGEASACRELLNDYRDGRLKLWVTMQALNLRRRQPDLFRRGSYMPLHVSRGHEEHVVTFARAYGSQAVIVAAPRLSYTLMKGREEAPLGAVWGDTELELPSQIHGRRLRNVMTGESFDGRESLLCRELFALFPLALLVLG